MKKEYDHFEYYMKTMKDPMPFGTDKYPQQMNDGTYKVFRNKKRVTGTKEEYDENFRLIHEQYDRFKMWLVTNPDPNPNSMYRSVLDDILLLIASKQNKKNE